MDRETHSLCFVSPWYKPLAPRLTVGHGQGRLGSGVVWLKRVARLIGARKVCRNETMGIGSRAGRLDTGQMGYLAAGRGETWVREAWGVGSNFQDSRGWGPKNRRGLSRISYRPRNRHHFPRTFDTPPYPCYTASTSIHACVSTRLSPRGYMKHPPKINFLTLWEAGLLRDVDYRHAVLIQSFFNEWYSAHFPTTTKRPTVEPIANLPGRLLSDMPSSSEINFDNGET